MKYKIENIRLLGNEHGELAANTVYAKLVDSNEELYINGTLEYILIAIRDRKLDVEGVYVSESMQRGTCCSKVMVDFEARKMP